MASKGLRVIPYQDTRKVEAGYKPSHTTEPLIGYTACYQLAFRCCLSFLFDVIWLLQYFLYVSEMKMQNLNFQEHMYSYKNVKTLQKVSMRN